MKKEDVPQDPSSLGKITNELCYVTDNTGRYTTALSKGWDIKITALDTAWRDIEEQVAAAREKVLRNEASPLYFFMVRGMMDTRLLAQYCGFWKWQVKRHMEPGIFKKLSAKKLQRYAEVFNVSIDELKNMTVHGDQI